MDLFGAEEGSPFDETQSRDSDKAPLAYRMSPRSIEEYVGQSHILGESKLLRRAIEADRVSSIILYGPPGTGKTALARVIAKKTMGSFRWLNAATAGLDDLRRVIKQARQDRQRGVRTILFLDEIHRFNKLQQDALLPDVEEGTLTLIAATVENPFFYVNSALLSRSQVFELKPLAVEDLLEIMERALADTGRGLGGLNASATPGALAFLAASAEAPSTTKRARKFSPDICSLLCVTHRAPTISAPQAAPMPMISSAGLVAAAILEILSCCLSRRWLIV